MTDKQQEPEKEGRPATEAAADVPGASGDASHAGSEKAVPSQGELGTSSPVDEMSGEAGVREDGPSPEDDGEGDASGQEARVTQIEAELAGERAAKEAALRERDELYDRWLRLQAEFDNYRKRTRRELEESKAKGAEELVVKLLPVIDNLERALNAAGSGASSGLLEGVKMIHRQFLSTLEEIGVTPIDAVGKPFDPNLHEAIAYEESDAYPDGVVMEELARGYALRGRALRPSMVKVARGSGQQGGEE